jgi:hypothetical protein
MPPAPWKTLASQYLVRDRWMKLRADRCETANGTVLDPYYVQEVDDWAQVVDASEDIEFEFLPLTQVLSLIDSGSFSQALHVSGSFLALRQRGMI